MFHVKQSQTIEQAEAVNEVENAVVNEVETGSDISSDSATPYVDPMRVLFIKSANPNAIKSEILSGLDALKKSVKDGKRIAYRDIDNVLNLQDLLAEVNQYKTDKAEAAKAAKAANAAANAN